MNNRRRYRKHRSGAKEAAEKLENSVEIGGVYKPGAKARDDFDGLIMRGLKPPPPDLAPAKRSP